MLSSIERPGARASQTTLGVLAGLSLALCTMAAEHKEFVFTTAPFASCHASTIVETAPGEFAAAWFGGTREGDKDVGIWLSRRESGAWTAPVEVAKEPDQPAWNPVLFKTADGVLWLYYKIGPSPERWTGVRRSSRDGGRSWSGEERLAAGLLGPIRAKPLLLEDGTLISGTSVESYQAWASWIERSTDHGETWTKHGPIAFPGVARGLIQPAPVRLPDGRLRVYMRATPAIGRVAYSDSGDGGLTWSEPRKTPLPNPNAGVDAVTLRDGRIVMIYNHTPKGRSPLNLAVTGNGDDWQTFLALESDPGEYSYPAIIQGSDGDLHMVYTWRRERVRYVRVPLGEVPGR